MKRKAPVTAAAGTIISNVTITNANTDDSAARLALANAIQANAHAAYELAKNLHGAPMISIENKE